MTNYDNESILIVGAGAIGRGFVAPFYQKKGYRIYFADNNKDLVDAFSVQVNKSYTTAFVNSNNYQFEHVNFEQCFYTGDEFLIPAGIQYIVFAVGILNLTQAAASILNALPKNHQVRAFYSVENDRASVDVISDTLQAIAPCYFGVPDVITSSDAPLALKEKSPLCLISENGELYLEGSKLESDADGLSESYVQKHWLCKKYLHNTPHAALAYLGAKKGYTYIHQAANDSEIAELAAQLMEQITLFLHSEYHIEHEFLIGYKTKEWSRFTDKLLFDPIERVGRNPCIKLQSDERLVVIAKYFTDNGECIEAISKSIAAAMFYTKDKKLNQLKQAFEPSDLLYKLTSISSTSMLGKLILSEFVAEQV